MIETEINQQAKAFEEMQRKQRSAFMNHKEMIYRRFLANHTPKTIAELLNTRIVGQSALTNAAANFLYYHALRQIKPELPTRPILISGPSGSGKTEVWRVAKKLFGETFYIEIIDGASITQEGWKGDSKLSSYIDEQIANGGILIVDEFDKLAKPNYEASGTNVSANIQAEFLKLLEGEYIKKNRYRPQNTLAAFVNQQIETKKMGMVLIGAFEDIRLEKKETIGFVGMSDNTTRTEQITDEEYIRFGVLPELIGRVATKVTTNVLTEDEYIAIIYNPYSRVSTITNVLREFEINVSDVVSEQEMRELIRRSKSNQTGVRWVSAQIESKILDVIHEQGVKGSLALTRQEIDRISQEVAESEEEYDRFFF